jgi:hypothetical protein
MEELIEKLCNSYFALLDQLYIGYPLTHDNLQEV